MARKAKKISSADSIIRLVMYVAVAVALAATVYAASLLFIPNDKYADGPGLFAFAIYGLVAFPSAAVGFACSMERLGREKKKKARHFYPTILCAALCVLILLLPVIYFLVGMFAYLQYQSTHK